jgi:hypothetical protein
MIYFNPIRTFINTHIQRNTSANKPVLKQLDKDTVSFSGKLYNQGCMDSDYKKLLNDAKYYDIVAQKLLQYASDDGITATRERYYELVNVLKDPNTDTESKVFLEQLKRDWRNKLEICIADLSLAK